MVNAVIMAAGMSSRFVPLCFEKPKGLLTVKGEVLVERQIRQLKEAGIEQIVLVTGYQKEAFAYLKDLFGVILVNNPEYSLRNNHSSIYMAKDYIQNTLICSADNYFATNPFLEKESFSYYAAQYAKGSTAEWCMQEDEEGQICAVTVGGENAWYMLGHSYWNESFCNAFLPILAAAYPKAETYPLFWEDLFIAHLPHLPMKIKKYPPGEIFEFDSLQELRAFDRRYETDSGSLLLARLAQKHRSSEKDLTDFLPLYSPARQVIGFSYKVQNHRYESLLETNTP